MNSSEKVLKALFIKNLIIFQHSILLVYSIKHFNNNSDSHDSTAYIQRLIQSALISDKKTNYFKKVKWYNFLQRHK